MDVIYAIVVPRYWLGHSMTGHECFDELRLDRNASRASAVFVTSLITAWSQAITPLDA